ncbi:15131_t:CDS:2 [Funneliformis geosporum]|nr:15131_t:CDS:2 [Funneliformis geosporum]
MKLIGIDQGEVSPAYVEFYSNYKCLVHNFEVAFINDTTRINLQAIKDDRFYFNRFEYTVLIRIE